MLKTSRVKRGDKKMPLLKSSMNKKKQRTLLVEISNFSSNLSSQFYDYS